MTPQDARQFLLAELDASKQVIAELSNEQLEAIVGGGFWCKALGCVACGKPSGRTSINQNPYYDPNWGPIPIRTLNIQNNLFEKMRNLRADWSLTSADPDSDHHLRHY